MLGEVVRDERCYGDPVVQKSITLFKKIPEEATYEDLTEQAGPMEEDFEDELEDFVMDIQGGDCLPTTPPPPNVPADVLRLAKVGVGVEMFSGTQL